MGGTRRFGPAVVLAALLAVAGSAPIVASIERSAAVDFYHFWLVGRVVQAGEAVDVYSPRARVAVGERAYQRSRLPGVGEAQMRAAAKFRRLETTATPFLYASFFPFLRGDYDVDRIAFNAGSTVAFLLALAALACRLGYGKAGALLLVAFVLVAFEPLASDVRVGNVNRLQLVFLVAYAWLLWDGAPGQRWRPGLAGAWMGLAVLWKPNLALPVAAILFDGWVRRDHRALVGQLVGLAVGAAAAFLVAASFFGTPEVWLWWVEAAGRLAQDFPISLEDGNLAPTRALEQGLAVRLGAAWPAAWLVLLGLVLRRAAVGLRSVPPPEGWAILVIGLACGVSLLASPLSWLHYYVLSLPLVVWVLRPDPTEAVSDAVQPRLYGILAAMAVAAVSMGPILRLFLSSSPGRWAALGNAGLVVLLGLGAFDLLRASTQGGLVSVGVPASSARDAKAAALASRLAIRDGSVCPRTDLSSPPTKPGSWWRWPMGRSEPSIGSLGMRRWILPRSVRRSRG